MGQLLVLSPRVRSQAGKCSSGCRLLSGFPVDTPQAWWEQPVLAPLAGTAPSLPRQLLPPLQSSAPRLAFSLPPSSHSSRENVGKHELKSTMGNRKKKKAKPCQRRENPSGFTPSSTVHSGAGAACGSEHFWGTQRDDSPRSVPAPGWMLGKQPQPLNNSPGSQPPESLIFGKL